MEKIYIALFSIGLFLGCTAFPNLALAQSDPKLLFFPDGLTDIGAHYDQPVVFSRIDENFFGGNLAAMDERPLTTPTEGYITTLRVSYLPSFYMPGMVRIDVKANGQMDFTWKQRQSWGWSVEGDFKSSVGDVPKDVASRISKILGTNNALLGKFEQKPKQQPGDPIKMIFDGAMFAFEVARMDSHIAFYLHDSQFPNDDLKALVLDLNMLHQDRLFPDGALSPAPKSVFIPSEFGKLTSEF